MRYFTWLVGVALLATPALADAALTPDQIKAGIGKWVWSESESHYTSGVYAKEQTMTITKNDATGITVSQHVSLKDGKTFDWHIDAPYDDQMRHASQWMSFAFSRLSDSQFHDRYKMDADGEEGAETFTITPTRLTIKGSSMHQGKDMPYIEVWDRVE
jgi:hypothetical protein